MGFTRTSQAPNNPAPALFYVHNRRLLAVGGNVGDVAAFPGTVDDPEVDLLLEPSRAGSHTVTLGGAGQDSNRTVYPLVFDRIARQISVSPLRAAHCSIYAAFRLSPETRRIPAMSRRCFSDPPSR